MNQLSCPSFIVSEIVQRVWLYLKASWALTNTAVTWGIEDDTPVMMVDMVSTVVIPAGGEKPEARFVTFKSNNTRSLMNVGSFMSVDTKNP